MNFFIDFCHLQFVMNFHKTLYMKYFVSFPTLKIFKNFNLLYSLHNFTQEEVIKQMEENYMKDS